MPVRLSATALTLLPCVLGAPLTHADAWSLIAESPNGKLTVMAKPHSVEFVRDSSGHWRLTRIIKYDAVTGKSTDDEIYLAGTTWSSCQKGFGVLTETTGGADQSPAPMLVAHGGDNMGGVVFDYLCSQGNILELLNKGPGANTGSDK